MRVKIKSWDRMKAEYGLDFKSGEYINVRGFFTPEMEEALSPSRIVRIIQEPFDEEFIGKMISSNNEWYIHPDMVQEYFIEEKDILDGEVINTKNLEILCKQINDNACWDKVGSAFYQIDDILAGREPKPENFVDLVKEFIEDLKMRSVTATNVGFVVEKETV